ncbi:hypothetical protein GOM49_15945 [Clostridium bovifaecis]|uniref:Lipoprotein n=1 Tax=Clostridium bovifaecis TaxID=2184719 RepID=A0A6I6FES3_9CLOT|nr:hypothetical protein GOM49_15945 [Clostridium bovifaecis]
MKEKILLKKDWLVLLISSIACIYYIVIQDFLEVNIIVSVLWSILNLVLVYRVVASISPFKRK